MGDKCKAGRMTVSEFLSELFKGCREGSITVMTLPGNHIEHFPVAEIGKAAGRIETLGAKANTYYNLALCREGLSGTQRGSAEDVHTVAALCADIDIKGPGHKQDALPETQEEALGFLDGLDLKPSVIINSGNGIHALWLLKEPYVIRSDDDRKFISAISAGFGAYLKREGQAHGWMLDNVQDIARMLRAPGTLNFKTDPPKECYVISYSGSRYPLASFEPYKAVLEDADEAFTAAENISVGPADRMVGHCAFIDYCICHADTLSEPWWHAMLSIVAQAEDGQEKCHEWSEPYPGYDYAQTEDHYRRMAKMNRPCSCRYIRDTLGFNCPEGGCQDCRDHFRTVGGPIAFSYYTATEQAQRLLDADLTLDEALSEKNISILLHAKEDAPSLYVRLKQKYQDKPLRIGMRDLERCMKAVETEKRKDTAEMDFFEGGVISLKGIRTDGLTAPENYSVTMSGMSKVTVANGFPLVIEVSPMPVVICRKLVNVDDDTEKLELAFLRSGHWKKLIAPRAQLLNKNTVIKYADNDLPVSSENAAALSSYFAKFEAVNDIPVCRCIARAGWFGDEFFPHCTKDTVVYQDEYSDTNRAMKALRTGGNEGAWLDMAVKLRTMPVARAMLAASFASPLLCRLQHRNIYIHLWHDSRSGKTAALKAALSIWGCPADLMGSYSSTAVGMERLAGTMKHLPLGLDELQSLNQKKMPASEIIYKLGNGIGKMRGLPGGGMRRTEEWNNCILSTGEQPMTNTSSMDGESTRVMEFYGKPISDEDFAGEVHRTSERNYGFAGEMYIRYLTSQLGDKPDAMDKSMNDQIRADLEAIRSKLADADGSGSVEDRGSTVSGVNFDNSAVLALADYYSSVAVFGLDHDKAMEEAIGLGRAVLKILAADRREDTTDSAWDFIKSYVASNTSHFAGNPTVSAMSPVYGKIDAQARKVYFISTIMNKALEDGGFSSRKCIKGFQGRGYIEITKDAQGKRRTQDVQRIGGVPSRVYVLNIGDIQPPNDDDEFGALEDLPEPM